MWDKALCDPSYPPPLIIPSLTQLQLHWPPSCSLIMVGRSHLTACSCCLEYPSPSCLHGIPLTSLKPFSNATFSGGGYWKNSMYSCNSLHAHSHKPDTLRTSYIFFYLSTGIYYLLPLFLVYLIMFLVYCLSPFTSV